MDLLFHVPYVLKDTFLLLVIGFPLAIWVPARRRDWPQVRWLTRLFVGLALIASGGFALTRLVSNAHAADIALGQGVALIAAGAAAVSWAAIGRRTRRERQAHK